MPAERTHLFRRLKDHTGGTNPPTSAMGTHGIRGNPFSLMRRILKQEKLTNLQGHLITVAMKRNPQWDARQVIAHTVMRWRAASKAVAILQERKQSVNNNAEILLAEIAIARPKWKPGQLANAIINHSNRILEARKLLQQSLSTPLKGKYYGLIIELALTEPELIPEKLVEKIMKLLDELHKTKTS